jgi:hypothetical protein
VEAFLDEGVVVVVDEGVVSATEISRHMLSGDRGRFLPAALSGSSRLCRHEAPEGVLDRLLIAPSSGVAAREGWSMVAGSGLRRAKTEHLR